MAREPSGKLSEGSIVQPRSAKAMRWPSIKVRQDASASSGRRPLIGALSEVNRQRIFRRTKIQDVEINGINAMLRLRWKGFDAGCCLSPLRLSDQCQRDRSASPASLGRTAHKSVNVLAWRSFRRKSLQFQTAANAWVLAVRLRVDRGCGRIGQFEFSTDLQWP